MAERIFVVDGTKLRDRRDRDAWKATREARERKLREVRAYMYSGWIYEGWGSSPAGHETTGFYFVREDDTSGPGFGSQALIDRLASGLHWASPVLDVDLTRLADWDDV